MYERESRIGEAEKVLDNFLSKIETRSKSPLEMFSNVASTFIII